MRLPIILRPRDLFQEVKKALPDNFYKQYIPSSNPNSTDQTSHPEPLVSRWKANWKLGVGIPGLGDNSWFLNWATSFEGGLFDLFADSLEGPSPSSYDIYAVSRVVPDGQLSSAAHWSVYTQGHFFHLSAETQNACPSDVAGNSQMAISGERIILKDDDYTPTGDIQGPSTGLLVAYQIGQTDYTPSEIHDVAQQIIDDMASYSLFSRNCQHFLSTLVMNILMRRRDNTLFVGTAKQITSWDLGSKRTGDHCNTAALGCAIMGPPTRGSSWKDKAKMGMDEQALRKFIISLRSPSGGLRINPAKTSPDYWDQSIAMMKTGVQDIREGRWIEGLFGRKVAVYYDE